MQKRKTFLRQKIVLVLVLQILFSGIFISCTRDEMKSMKLEEDNNMVSSQEATNEKIADENSQNIQKNDLESIFVYVCGAVVNEGVYELPVGSRAYEAIEKAGGLRADAAAAQINQAEILSDEKQLYIPTKYEVLQQQELQKEETDGRININSATREELMTLPGVGEAKADSIVKYREVNGPFQSIEDIMMISGIKNGLFEKIKDYIKV